MAQPVYHYYIEVPAGTAGYGFHMKDKSLIVYTSPSANDAQAQNLGTVIAVTTNPPPVYPPEVNTWLSNYFSFYDFIMPWYGA